MPMRVCSQGIIAKYVDKYKPLVSELSQKFQIPFSIIMGIAIVESGAGTSKNCKLLKNHFGFVGKNTASESFGIKTKFKQYKTDKESFMDFCTKISQKKFYSKLKGNRNYNLWIIAMSNAGYSESPTVWRRLINNCIVKYKLNNIVTFDNWNYELQQTDTLLRMDIR